MSNFGNCIDSVWSFSFAMPAVSLLLSRCHAFCRTDPGAWDASAKPNVQTEHHAYLGDLRQLSSCFFQHVGLQAAAMLVPPGAQIVLYTRLGDLPHFNPDLDTDEPPQAVQALRREIGRCDGLLICSPEYARGVAGSMKNALDWLVSSPEFPGKPVALINTSQRALHADAQLRETLTTMSARLVERASITLPLLGSNLDPNGIVADPRLSAQPRAALDDFVAAIRSEAASGDR
jgi:chromate reductase